MTPRTRRKGQDRHHDAARGALAKARHASGDEVRMVFGILAAAVVVVGVVAMILFPGLRGGSADSPDEPSAPRDLIVLAAASLADPLQEAVDAYEKADRLRSIQLSLASSNLLRRQIERGAPADLFISASPEHIEALRARGWVEPEDVQALWTTQLVVIAPTAERGPAADTDEGTPPALWAALSGARKVAIGDLGVPVGEYARESLETLGWKDRLEDRLVPMIDEAAVIRAVANRSCDRGIAYAAGVERAVAEKKVRILLTLPPSSHRRIVYQAAVLADAEHPRRSRRFLDFLTTGGGREILRRAGFVPVDASLTVSP